MTDSVLSSLVDAYRAEHSARSLDQRGLRQRIVAAAGRRRLRRTERLRLLLPLAATFAGSVALAASPPVREHVRDAFAFVRAGVTSPAGTGVRGRTKAAPPTSLPPSPAAQSQASAAPVVTAIASLPLEAAPERPVHAPVNAPASVERPPVVGSSGTTMPGSAAPPNADFAAYRRAHELHFGAAARARALAAWDEYLGAFPRGTFAPEARLNRAVCLAQLGRKSEAEDVLSDIERGRFGKEGRGQARKILGALSEDD